ncbi:MAG: hypothetical protein FWF35_02850 [Elusimicrobia bacterium]|nr:hypothetical protein [Elusimicrobiota bacterium]
MKILLTSFLILLSVIAVLLLLKYYEKEKIDLSPAKADAKTVKTVKGVRAVKTIPPNVYKVNTPGYPWMEDVLFGDKKIVFMTGLIGCPYSAQRRANVARVFQNNPQLNDVYRTSVKMVGGSERFSCQARNEQEMQVCSYTADRMNFLLGTCGSTYNFCIINPVTRQYVVSKNTDVAESERLLLKYADW